MADCSCSRSWGKLLIVQRDLIVGPMHAQIGFNVTKKDKSSSPAGWDDFKAALAVTWYFLV